MELSIQGPFWALVQLVKLFLSFSQHQNKFYKSKRKKLS
jgi:hypothetical protein